MAGGGFPEKKSQGSGGMTGSGGPTTMLDGPPPSPAGASGPVAPGVAMQPPPSMAEMAPPMTAGTPGRATTPEIAQGLMASAETIFSMFDSMASIAPDLGNDFALLKNQLQSTMAKLLLNGGQPATPNAPGANFPGGGFLSGM